MGRDFKEIFLMNILVVIVLVPMVILLNALIVWEDNPILWIILGILGIAGISCLIYRREQNEMS